MADKCILAWLNLHQRVKGLSFLNSDLVPDIDIEEKQQPFRDIKFKVAYRQARPLVQSLTELRRFCEHYTIKKLNVK